eukprot:3447151-Rhodomonas_salina.1
MAYYGWVDKPNNGQKGGERMIAWEGIDDNEYKVAVKYFKKHAVNDVERIHEAWAEDKIKNWFDSVPGSSLSPKKKHNKKTRKHAKPYNMSQSVHELHANNGIVTHIPPVRPVSKKTGDFFEFGPDMMSSEVKKTKTKTRKPFVQKQNGSPLGKQTKLWPVKGSEMTARQYAETDELFGKETQYTPEEGKDFFAAQEVDLQKYNGKQQWFVFSERGIIPLQMNSEKQKKGSVDPKIRARKKR